jgi:hypothetical protein
LREVHLVPRKLKPSMMMSQSSSRLISLGN